MVSVKLTGFAAAVFVAKVSQVPADKLVERWTM